MDSIPSTLPSLYHPSVKTCAVTCVDEQPALALLGADYPAWRAGQTPSTLAPLMEALDTAADTLLAGERGEVDTDFQALHASQPLPERRAPSSAESHLIIGAADYLYARQRRPEREHDEPAQRFARYLAEAAGYRACPRCLTAYTGAPLAHVCAAEELA